MIPIERGPCIRAATIAGILASSASAMFFPAARSANAAGLACASRPTVALDIGHTLAQPGAISARGVPEFEYNRWLAAALATALTEAGIAPVVIGASGAPLGLSDRPRLAQAAKADLFLSLHHDSVQPRYLQSWTVDGQPRPYSDAFRGYSVFVSAENGRAVDSTRLGVLIGRSLRDAGFTPTLHHAEPIPGENRPLLDATIGLYRFDKLVVLRTATMPAALLEAAVIVNRAEEEQVRSSAFLNRLAAAVVQAIQRFCASPR